MMFVSTFERRRRLLILIGCYITNLRLQCHVSHTAIQCYELDLPENGTVVYSGPNYNFGDTATYSCDIGFGLSGSTERTCSGNGRSPMGEWSGTDPICEGMHLGKTLFVNSQTLCFSV